MRNEVPKNSEIAEIEVLSILLNDPKLHHSTEDILQVPETFYKTSHALIYGLMLEIHQSGNPATLSKVIPLLRSKALSNESEIIKEIATIKASHGDDLELTNTCLYLRELYTLRKAHEIGESVIRSNSLDDLTPKATALSDCIAGVISKSNVITAAESSKSALEIILNRKKGLTGVDTGLKVLNHETQGWQNTDIVIIAGRPAMGKTTVAIHHALGAAMSGVPVAFVTLEMSAIQLTNRMLSNLSGVFAEKIKTDNLSDYDKKLLIEAQAKMAQMPIYFYDAENSDDIGDIANQMRNWKRKFNIGLVIIDYLQLVTDRTIKGSEETARISSVSRKIKRKIQSSLKLPVIALAQLSRAIEGRADKRPIQSDLRSSGQIEQDASIIIGLYRGEYYEDAEAIPGTIEYCISKNRDGTTGNLLFQIRLANFQMNDMRMDSPTNENPPF